MTRFAATLTLQNKLQVFVGQFNVPKQNGKARAKGTHRAET